MMRIIAPKQMLKTGEKVFNMGLGNINFSIYIFTKFDSLRGI